MATVLESAKRAAVPRFDSLVEAKLQKAESRVRSIDTTAGALGLAVLTLGYALAMALLDHAFEFPLWLRLLAFAGFITCVGIWSAWTLVRPFLRKVNPYFTARRLEQAVPAAKNSVVNWLDLRGQNLPPSIQAAL